MPHTKFTSINRFASVYKGQNMFSVPAKVRYGAKIKLHGTNAGVRISEGEVTAQGRNRDLSIGDDQFGFNYWVQKHAEEWTAVPKNMYAPKKATVVVHGEWAGRGIQKSDAVSRLEVKRFYVFAIEVDGEMIVEPDEIESYLPDLWELMVLPWYSIEEEDLDFSDRTACSIFSKKAAAEVEKIGTRDPFIAEFFGVEGPGEGLVYVPTNYKSRDMYSYLTFKAKAEHHGVNKKKQTVSVEVEVPENVKGFVDMFVTIPRMEQAVSEGCAGVIDPKTTGDFLKWMGQDIVKESKDELEESGLTWKDVNKSVTKKSLEWFKAQFKEIV